MRFILKVSGIFLLSLLLIFTLAACGDKDKGKDTPSVITGTTDNGDDIDIDDIFGNDSGSQTDSSSGNSSDSSDPSSSDNSSQDSSGSESGPESSSNNSSGINYDDPSVWTDPV